MIVALLYLVDTSGWLALCFPITLTTTQTTSIYINLLRQVDSPELSEVDLAEGRFIDHFNYQCHYATQTNWIQLTDLKYLKANIHMNIVERGGVKSKIRKNLGKMSN